MNNQPLIRTVLRDTALAVSALSAGITLLFDLKINRKRESIKYEDGNKIVRNIWMSKLYKFFLCFSN